MGLSGPVRPSPQHPSFTLLRVPGHLPRVDRGGSSPRQGTGGLTWDGVGVCDIVLHQHLGHRGVWDPEGLIVRRLELANHPVPVPKGPPAREAGRQGEGWGGSPLARLHSLPSPSVPRTRHLPAGEEVEARAEPSTSPTWARPAPLPTRPGALTGRPPPRRSPPARGQPMPAWHWGTARVALRTPRGPSSCASAPR